MCWAVDGYERTSEFYTREEHPVNYAGTIFKSNPFWLQTGKLTEAEQAFVEAEEMFREQRLTDWAERARKGAETAREIEMMQRERE